MKTRIAAAALVGALALAPGVGFAAEQVLSLEQFAAEAAHTPAQHAALAQYYHSRALEARAEAQRHEEMARTYSAGKLTQRQHMQQHCSKLSKEYTQIADEFEALARLQEDEAKAAN